VIGGQVGYNWTTCNTLWGVELDGDWSSARASTQLIPNSPFFNINIQSRFDSLVTARTRAGLVFDNVLLYVTGGWAWSEVEVTTANSNNGGVLPVRIVTDHVTAPGWTVGGGLEMSLWSNWTGKIEYQLVHSDTITFKTVGTHVDSIGETGPPVRFDLQTIRIGVNYLFH